MRRLATYQTVRSARAGFTIVELMMVVGILLFLIATSAFVVRNIGNKARARATMATITKINGLLSQRVQSFQKELDSNRNQKLLQSRVNSKRAALVNATGKKGFYSLSAPVVEILVRKDLFREQFPQYVGDNTDVNAAMDAIAGGSGIAGADGSDNGLSISSEYLYYALTRHDSFGLAPVGEDSFTASEVKDTDGDGLMEFVDGWGRPLRFYRWPTHLIKPYGAGLQRTLAGAFFSNLPPQPNGNLNERDPLRIDPDDPLGRISDEDTRVNSLLSSQLFNDAASYTVGQYGTMDVFWMPLIVSAGEDGILGLYEPSDITNNGVLAQPVAVPGVEGIYDNITNYNQRAGGN